MIPEDRLEQILSQPHLRGDGISPREAGLVDAAASVREVRFVGVPPALAARMEQRVRDHTRAQKAMHSSIPPAKEAAAWRFALLRPRTGASCSQRAAFSRCCS